MFESFRKIYQIFGIKINKKYFSKSMLYIRNNPPKTNDFLFQVTHRQPSHLHIQEHFLNEIQQKLLPLLIESGNNENKKRENQKKIV